MSLLTLLKPVSKNIPTRVLRTTPLDGYSSADSPKTTPTFDVQAGDLLVVVGISTTQSETLGTPTWTGSGTFTLRESILVDSRTAVYLWTAESATTATGRTVTVTRTGTIDAWGFDVNVWRNHGGLGVTGKTNAMGSPSLSLTTAANSAVQTSIGDYAEVDGASRTWQSINGTPMTETHYGRHIGNYTVYGAYHYDVGIAGSKTLGLSVTTPFTETFNASTTWVCPVGVTSVTIEAVGGGGGGGSNGGFGTVGGSGGGGSAYATKTNHPVTPGQSYSIVVGGGGSIGGNSATPSNPGGDSTFDSTVVVAKGGGGAKGGDQTAPRAGVGGQASACTPTTGAVSGSNGQEASGTTGGIGGAAASGGSITGGAGGALHQPGSAPGGGGGGRDGAGLTAPGVGAAGRVVLTYIPPLTYSMVGVEIRAAVTTLNKVYAGASLIGAKVGATDVSKMYVGATQVWP